MALDCDVARIGDKLSLHAGGLLTLTAFKFGIAENLPSVPYSTFTDFYLMLQVVTLVVASIFGLFMYRVEESGLVRLSTANGISIALFFVLSIAWTGSFTYSAFLKKRVPWDEVLQNQDKLPETMDAALDE